MTGPGDDKAASLGLLRSQLDKVAVEVDSERNVELNIQVSIFHTVCTLIQLTLLLTAPPPPLLLLE